MLGGDAPGAHTARGRRDRRAVTRRATAQAWVGSVLVLVTSAGCSPVPARFDAAPYVGRYVGEWEHQPGGRSGPVRIEVALSAKLAAATVTVDFDGDVLGRGDPPAASVTVLLDGETATARAGAVILGQYSFEIRPDGTISGTSQEFLRGTLGSLACSGSVTAVQLDVSCTGSDQPPTVFTVRAARPA